MKLKIETHIPPGILLKKVCGNCALCSVLLKGDESVETCTFAYISVQATDLACDAYESAHWETIRVNDYIKLG